VALLPEKCLTWFLRRYSGPKMHRRRFCHRAYLVTFRRFGGDTVLCPVETAAYDLEWPVGDLATQLFGSDGSSNG